MPMGEGFFVVVVGGLISFIYCTLSLEAYSIMSEYLIMLRKNMKMLLCFTGGTCPCSDADPISSEFSMWIF